MSDLTDFLLARIAEDEAAARAASVVTEWNAEVGDHVPIPSEPAIWVAGGGYGGGAVERTNGHPHEVGIVVYDEGSPSGAEAFHIARHDPARVLGECQAKRQIVELAAEAEADYERTPDYDDELLMARGLARRALRLVLLDLASIYADHPDFRPEWRVQPSSDSRDI